MSDCSDQHVLITGGGSGIGLAIAKAFANCEAKISIVGRDREKLKLAAKNISGVQYHVMDVTKEESVNAGFEEISKINGPVTILVNNAGMALSAPFAKTSVDDWDRIQDVNLKGVFLCTKAAVPSMMEHKQGRIINISSTAGLKGFAYTSAYSAAKHGVIGLTRSLAIEFARWGITVNAVCPGFTNTGIVDDALSTIMKKTGLSQKEALAKITKLNPGGRLIEPEEVADVVLWLASTDARSTTGQEITVAGGEVAS